MEPARFRKAILLWGSVLLKSLGEETPGLPATGRFVIAVLVWGADKAGRGRDAF